MELILLRHGIAQNISSDGSDDARELTAEGKQRTLEASRGLFWIIGKPAMIYTSPKTRAMQTADIFAKVAGASKPVIAPVIAESSTDALMDFVLKQDYPSLLVVGHEPTLGELAARLCTGRESGSSFMMKKAGAVCITLPATARMAAIPGQLDWLIPPSTLRQLGHHA